VTKTIRLSSDRINPHRIRIVRRGVVEPKVIETDTKAIPAPTKPNGRSNRSVKSLVRGIPLVYVKDAK
jgi:hypothetical protein